MKRNPEIVVISDVHLGTYGCRAEELNSYLKSINPQVLILNGDIIDIWQFSKNYWPKSHMKVVNRILKMIANGTKVYYITGNHDELLRKFVDFKLGNFTICNKLILEVNQEKHWFFHGDVFDMSVRHSKWLAKLGGKGYDMLIFLNSMCNNALEYFGFERVSFSKKIKNSVKSAIKYIQNFEKSVAEMAAYHQYDVVVCGHIHQPEDRMIDVREKKIRYMNSGDWIENLSSLEFEKGSWSLTYFNESELYQHPLLKEEEDEDPVDDIIKEFEPVFAMLKSVS